VRLRFKVSMEYKECWLVTIMLIRSTPKIVRIESMIEMHHTLLKQHYCNLNMCELYMMYLDGHDIGSK
jgi:hypothetical protein